MSESRPSGGCGAPDGVMPPPQTALPKVLARVVEGCDFAAVGTCSCDVGLRVGTWDLAPDEEAVMLRELAPGTERLRGVVVLPVMSVVKCWRAACHARNLKRFAYASEEGPMISCGKVAAGMQVLGAPVVKPAESIKAVKSNYGSLQALL